MFTPGWKIGHSGLGINTYLGGFMEPILANLDDYRANALAQPSVAMLPWAGTPTYSWAMAQNIAYTYELRIYGYALPAGLLSALDLMLSRNEYARDKHIIRDNLSRVSEALIESLSPVDQLVNVTEGYPAVFTDSGSSSGYSGWSLFDG
jgi:hypothetical protein